MSGQRYVLNRPSASRDSPELVRCNRTVECACALADQPMSLAKLYANDLIVMAHEFGSAGKLPLYGRLRVSQVNSNSGG